MARYLRKSNWVEARQFTTNNEPGNQEMDSIVVWLNSNGTKATHDGTTIKIQDASGKLAEINVGDWMLYDHKGRLSAPVARSVFAEDFEECNHSWEPVDDSDYDQCVDCGETKQYEQQYFGDEAL